MLYKFEHRHRVEEELPEQFIKDFCACSIAKDLLAKMSFDREDTGREIVTRAKVAVLHESQVTEVLKYLDLLSSVSPAVRNIANEIKREILEM